MLISIVCVIIDLVIIYIFESIVFLPIFFTICSWFKYGLILIIWRNQWESWRNLFLKQPSNFFKSFYHNYYS